jgi:hypothetical protein
MGQGESTCTGAPTTFSSGFANAPVLLERLKSVLDTIMRAIPLSYAPGAGLRKYSFASRGNRRAPLTKP